MKAFELFRKYPKPPDFNHSNYRLFERIRAVPGTSNNQGLTVFSFKSGLSLTTPFLSFLKLPDILIRGHPTWENIVYNLTVQTAQ